LRYNANTSESSGIKALEMSWTAFSERVVGVVDGALCNILASLIVGWAPFNRKHKATLPERYNQRIANKSFPALRFSIK
jgi:hypothetical protein